jgi:hypothetical protein
LDGSTSTDPDGTIASYSWIQTAGPSVVLNDANTNSASFTAPSVSVDTQLKFSLTVKDDKGESSSPSIVTITVKAEALPPPPPPITAPSNMSTTSPSKEQYSFIRGWGSTGTGNGQFSDPSDAAIDSSGDVYIADWGNNRIQKFTSDGTFITAWGSEGTGNGQLDGPDGIAVDSSGNVYVADSSNNRIQKFTSDGTFITAWGSSSPDSIAIDSSGDVYVSDVDDSRILVFALSSPPSSSNHPPVADAGLDQTVNAGYVVSLDGTQSEDPDDDPLTYSWEQIVGPMITLDNANTASPSFTAPTDIIANTVLTFDLTITDDKGARDTSTVKVTVNHIASSSPLSPINPKEDGPSRSEQLSPSYLAGNWMFSGTLQGKFISGSITFNFGGSYNIFASWGGLPHFEPGCYVFYNLLRTFQLNNCRGNIPVLYSMNNIEDDSFHASAIGGDFEFKRK